MPASLHNGRWLVAALASLAILGGVWMRWEGLAWGFGDGPPRLFHPDERRLASTAEALETGADFQRGYVLAQPQLIRLLAPATASLATRVQIGRWMSLAAGLALIAACAALAVRLGASGWVAAGFAALNTLCVIHSHFATADMLYALLLCLFTLAVLAGSPLAAAACAGLAMATKYGVVLIPSLLWLAVRHRGRGALGLGLALLLFFAAQGFAFGPESFRAVARSFTQDNAGGFVHDNWMNLPVYAAVLVRALGIPVALLACAGLGRLRGVEGPRERVLPALLPYALHAAGLMLLSASFPRHALPLLPPLIVFAAWAWGRMPLPAQPLVLALALAWSGLLAWSDGRAFTPDARARALAWMDRTLPHGAAVWTSPFWEGPAWHTPAPKPSSARYLVLSEAWSWRFERSEVNPLRAPDDARLYHAEPGDLAWYGRLQEAVQRGGLRSAFAAGPRLWLPEQRAYDRAWGSFEKFAGSVRILEMGVAP